MLEFLPQRILDAVQALNFGKLYELRMRADMPLSANLGGNYVFLGKSGVVSSAEAIFPTKEEVETALLAACGYSLYAVESELRESFVTAANGERLGIAGTVVREGGKVLAVRDVTSLCIRIPHEVRGCAEEIYGKIFPEGLPSLLLLGRPGEGKTTILRDLARLLSERKLCNLLLCDERGELARGNVGLTSDVVRYADKESAFTCAIRAMRPDVIVCDELLPADYGAVRRATESGIPVIASAHLLRYEDVPQKLFSHYVLLGRGGKVSAHWDGEGNRVD